MAPEAVAEAFHAFEQGGSSVAPLTAAAVSNQSIQESMRLLLLVRAYQVRAPHPNKFAVMSLLPQVLASMLSVVCAHSPRPYVEALPHHLLQ